MKKIKTEITKIHYNKNAKGFLFNTLRFCSIFYGLGSGLKNLLYDRGILTPKKVDAFVISVGNLTTGGVGKTPVVAEIAKYLIEKGEKTAIVSRGYGGKLSNKNINLISDGERIFHTAEDAGDEPFWLAENTKAVVVTSKNRIKASEYAIKTFGVTRIILDDGFQHRKLHRDLDIVLMDSEKMFGNENLLPAGPLREGLEGFRRVNKLLIVSKNVDHTRAEKLVKIMEKKVFGKIAPSPQPSPAGRGRAELCKIEPDYIYNIVSGEHLEKGAEITALSAIGQPEQFYKFLEKDYKIKDKLTFDDHHQYTKDDIENVGGIIVTTEKDAVKLAHFNKSDIYALKLKTVLDVEKLLESSSTPHS